MEEENPVPIASAFESMAEQDVQEEGTPFDALVEQDENPEPLRPALRSTTLMTALARVDPKRDPQLQLGEDSIAAARELLELGREKELRYQIAGQRTERQLAGLNRLRQGLGPMADASDVKAVEDAYQRVLHTDYEKRARVALEEEAIERIQDMAARDPVQARVLLDNLEKGDANKTMGDFQVKMAILQQRAEELDDEYQQSGWGRAILNFALNLVPTNYNFQRSGVVEPSNTGFWDWFRTGENLRKQSETLWNMAPEDFAEYAKPDGELMKMIRENSSTVLGLTHDPLAAVEIINALTVQGDSDRQWANAWGIVEPATLLPFGKITNATRSLIRAGAAKEAVDNLAVAVRTLDTDGPEAMARVTGVTEREVTEEMSVTAVNPNRSLHDVPLAEQVATREESARRALGEIMDPPAGERFNSMDEIKAAYDAAVEKAAVQVGRPIKDVAYKVEDLAGGGQVRYVEVTFGKKNGHGFAKESTAFNAARTSGIGGEAIEVVETATRIVDPKEGFDLRVFHGTTNQIDGAIRPSNAGKLGPAIYVSDDAAEASTYASRGGRPGGGGLGNAPSVYPMLVRSEKIYGINRGEKWTRGEVADFAKQIDVDIEDLVRIGDQNGKYDGWDIIEEAQRITDRAAGDQVDELGFNSGAALNARLAAKGWDGISARPYGGPKEIAVFSPDSAVSAFEAAKTFRDVSGQWFVRSRVNVPETGFFTNTLHQPTQGFISRMFGRYTRAAPRISDPDLHGRALEGGSYINRAHKIIEKNILGEFKKLNKQSYEAVQQIALKGANEERWWKPEEFNYLMERAYGRAATKEELHAYQQLQLFNDMDWVIRNDTLYMDRVIKGYESVEIELPWGQLIDEDVTIRYAPDVVPADRVYNLSDNVHYTRQQNPLSSAELDRLRNKGYVLIEFPNGFDLPQGIIVNKMLAKRSDLNIKPLRRNQLAYSEGGHRMYTDKYFVKQGKKGKQSDTGTEYLKAPSTFITAPNKAEAGKWASVMDRARLLVKNEGASAQRLDDEIFAGSNAFPSGDEFLEQIENGIIDLDNPFEAVFDRELPSMYKASGEDITRLFNDDELGINGYYRTTGRMYTSSKGAHLKDHTGNLATTVDPYEVLATSLRQITRNTGLFSYKQEALERFKNTYAQFLDIQPNHRYPAQVLTDAKVRPDVPIEMRNQIEAQRAAILNVLRFETPGDKLRNEMYRSTAEWVLGTGDNVARKWAHDAVWWFRERSPVSFLRGLAFDAKLGMFNIAQLFIQASTMVSATALSPRYGMRGMMGLFPMHGYLLSRGSENVLDTLTKRGVGRHMGFASDEEFKEYARHLNTSGFTDMNGSHIMINDYGPTAHFGSFADKVNNFREQARVFFYTPETYNRLVAYRIAWGEATDAGLRAGDPKFNSTVLRLADDYSLNMTQESAAFWQKGVLSIPTQFWAYNVRMMDAMFGTRFSPAQRARLMLANVGMAGAAGIPGLAALSSYLKDKNGASPDIDSLMGAADRGMIDYLTYQFTGSDILVGERVGTGTWASDTVKALFGASAYGEKSFMDLIGGATYSIGKSTGSTLYEVAKYAAAESGSDMGDMAMTKEALIKMLGEISTINNATKAMLVHQYGMYKSKSGTILADDLPPTDAIYVALSFRPAKSDEIGHLMAWRQNRDENIKEVATKIRNWRQEAFNNPDKFEENMKKSNALIRLLPAEAQRDVIRKTNAITDDSLYDYLERKVHEEKTKEGPTE